MKLKLWPFGKSEEKGLPYPQRRYQDVQAERYSFSSSVSFKELVKQGLYNNAAVQGCVAVYSMTLNEAPIRVQVGGADADNHPLALLMRRPNPFMSAPEFWSFVASYTAIGGNCYVVKVRNIFGQVVELYPYHDGQIQPVAGEYSWIDSYRYVVDGSDRTIPAADVIQFRSHIIDPLKPHKGMSLILAAARGIDIYGEMESMVYAMLKNDAMPRGVLSFPAGAALGKEAKENLKEHFSAEYGGTNRGRTAVVSDGATYTRMSFDLKELQADNIISKAEVSICQAFRVHPLVAMTYAGLLNSTYSNIEEAFKQFTLLVRVPTWVQWAQTLEAGFLGDFKGVELSFDTSRVASLQPKPEELAKSVTLQFEKGLITQNEGRKALGLDATGADKYLFELSAPTPQLSVVAQPQQAASAAQPKDGGVNVEDKTGLGYTYKGEPWTEEKADAVYKDKFEFVSKHKAELEAVLIDTLSKLEESVVGGVKSGRKGGDPFNYDEWKNRFLHATSSARMKLIREAIKAALLEVGANVDDFAGDIDAVIKASSLLSSEKIAQSIGTIRDELREFISAHADSSASELKTLLQDKFTALKSGRAGNIAQTTTGAVTNATQRTTWQKMNARTSDPKNKITRVWLIRGVNSRPAHAKLDRVPESEEGTWNLNGVTVQYPIDSALSASDACNCHCTTTTVRGLIR